MQENLHGEAITSRKTKVLERDGQQGRTRPYYVLGYEDIRGIYRRSMGIRIKERAKASDQLCTFQARI